MRRGVLPKPAFLLFVGGFLFLSGGPLAEAAGEKGVFEATGRKWAFCIGIGDYRDPEIMDTPWARTDAKGIARVLQEHGGFEEVLVLTDDQEERSPLFPSSRHIQALLHQAAPRIRKEDLVLFSFSGHGVTDPSGRGYLLTADSRLGAPSVTGIPLEAVLDFLKKTGVKRSILLIDAARDKVHKKGGFSPEGVYPDRYLRKDVTAVFYAARKGYTSHEDEDSAHGVFASCLIRGMEGAADREYGGNKDGLVSLAELASYVNLALTGWSLKGPLRQVPFTQILDPGVAYGMITSVQKIGVARPLSTGMPALAEVVPREKKELERKAAAKEVQKQPKERPRKEPPKMAVQEKGAEPARKVSTPEVKAPIESPSPPVAREPAAVKEPKPSGVVGAPAPRISDLIKEEKPEVPKKEIEPPAPSPAAAKEVPAPPAPPAEKPAPKEIALAPAAIPPKDVPPAVAPEAPRDRKPLERVAAVPPQVRKDVLRLRSRGKDLSTQEVKSMLTSRNFYATCWNYNGDFCNPDGEFENAFGDNGDGTVSDAATGLMWQKAGSEEAVTWISAREYAEKTNRERVAGHADWRIPTAEELASLMESSWKNSDLFIDPLFDRKQRQCWSVDTRGLESAWKANFHMGLLMDFPMTSKNSVRLVRSLQ
ncbi:MAG: DUF1566 domain-containing protein [Thermodesulfobacteriota bacterium]